ncbi:unnamed protein product [Notodromas monacha]|uniref:Uncharacterized protein n=1 Tax=Notodromas monacha TaxID=399045 RepID=A0A7R9BP33_9CRUS|nr:unnamed protein product [Notodromas monacha]CAG0919047.1 unnamed protein product [Notodromas monacha]
MALETVKPLPVNSRVAATKTAISTGVEGVLGTPSIIGPGTPPASPDFCHEASRAANDSTNNIVEDGIDASDEPFVSEKDDDLEEMSASEVPTALSSSPPTNDAPLTRRDSIGASSHPSKPPFENHASNLLESLPICDGSLSHNNDRHEPRRFVEMDLHQGSPEFGVCSSPTNEKLKVLEMESAAILPTFVGSAEFRGELSKSYQNVEMVLDERENSAVTSFSVSESSCHSLVEMMPLQNFLNVNDDSRDDSFTQLECDASCSTERVDQQDDGSSEESTCLNSPLKSVLINRDLEVWNSLESDSSHIPFPESKLLSTNEGYQSFGDSQDNTRPPETSCTIQSTDVRPEPSSIKHVRTNPRSGTRSKEDTSPRSKVLDASNHKKEQLKYHEPRDISEKDIEECIDLVAQGKAQAYSKLEQRLEAMIQRLRQECLRKNYIKAGSIFLRDVSNMTLVEEDEFLSRPKHHGKEESKHIVKNNPSVYQRTGKSEKISFKRGSSSKVKNESRGSLEKSINDDSQADRTSKVVSDVKASAPMSEKPKKKRRKAPPLVIDGVVVKRKPGRPRIHPVPEFKRRPGRPKKNSLEDEVIPNPDFRRPASEIKSSVQISPVYKKESRVFQKTETRVENIASFSGTSNAPTMVDPGLSKGLYDCVVTAGISSNSPKPAGQESDDSLDGLVDDTPLLERLKKKAGSNISSSLDLGKIPETGEGDPNSPTKSAISEEHSSSKRATLAPLSTSEKRLKSPPRASTSRKVSSDQSKITSVKNGNLSKSPKQTTAISSTSSKEPPAFRATSKQNPMPKMSDSHKKRNGEDALMADGKNAQSQRKKETRRVSDKTASKTPETEIVRDDSPDLGSSQCAGDNPKKMSKDGRRRRSKGRSVRECSNDRSPSPHSRSRRPMRKRRRPSSRYRDSESDEASVSDSGRSEISEDCSTDDEGYTRASRYSRTRAKWRRISENRLEELLDSASVEELKEIIVTKLFESDYSCPRRRRKLIRHRHDSPPHRDQWSYEHQSYRPVLLDERARRPRERAVASGNPLYRVPLVMIDSDNEQGDISSPQERVRNGSSLSRTSPELGVRRSIPALPPSASVSNSLYRNSPQFASDSRPPPRFTHDRVSVPLDSRIRPPVYIDDWACDDRRNYNSPLRVGDYPSPSREELYHRFDSPDMSERSRISHYRSPVPRSPYRGISRTMREISPSFEERTNERQGISRGDRRRNISGESAYSSRVSASTTGNACTSSGTFKRPAGRDRLRTTSRTCEQFAEGAGWQRPGLSAQVSRPQRINARESKGRERSSWTEVSEDNFVSESDAETVFSVASANPLLINLPRSDVPTEDRVNDFSIPEYPVASVERENVKLMNGRFKRLFPGNVEQKSQKTVDKFRANMRLQKRTKASMNRLFNAQESAMIPDEDEPEDRFVRDSDIDSDCSAVPNSYLGSRQPERIT